MALFDYLRENVSGSNCELVSCLTGEEEKDLIYNDVIKLSEFKLEDKYKFLQNQHIEIIK